MSWYQPWIGHRESFLRNGRYYIQNKKTMVRIYSEHQVNDDAGNEKRAIQLETYVNALELDAVAARNVLDNMCCHICGIRIGYRAENPQIRFMDCKHCQQAVLVLRRENYDVVDGGVKVAKGTRSAR